MLLGVLLALFLQAGCSGGETNVEAGNRDGVLHLGNATEPQTLDPHVMSGSPEARIAGALFEGLLTRNPYTLELEPGVAQRWTLSDDRRIITLYLNPRARWSNGDPVTATDFEWSFQRALNPALGNQMAYTFFPIVNAQEYFSGELSDPQAMGIRALDEHTLQLTLRHPTPFFLQLLSSYTTYPVHRPTLEAHGKVTDRYTPWTRVENIVSNGPFTLHEWKLQKRLVVVRNEHYWNAGQVELNAAVFHPVDNQITEEKMFRAGQLHYTNDVPVNKIAAYRTLDESPYRQAPLLGTYYYLFNTRVPPVDDVRVRQALARAIDRETVVSSILQGSEVTSFSLTPPGIPHYRPPAMRGYDPEAARRLLAEAGYPGGRGWPGLELTYNTQENHRRVAVAIQRMWKEVLNIDVTLANQEWKVLLDTLNEMDFQVARMGWIGGYLDPNTFLVRFITDGGTNRTGFSNARYDEIMTQLAPTAGSPEARLKLLYEAESILMEQAPIIPIYTYNSKHLVHPSVEGLPSNALDTINLRYVRLGADRPGLQREE